jgi:uncharacterized protein with PIN domain
MSQVWFRFYEELNDFLPDIRKKQSFSCTISGNPSVKDIIESLGVPHVEVDMILVNGKSVDFCYRLKDGDQVSVYPVFESFDISEATHLREKPLRELKFILDVHLGKLVKYLRLCGFNTYYDNNYDDQTIIDISLSEKRLILTHDRGLLKNSRVTRGYWVRSLDPDKQIMEIIERFDLKNNFNPFARCLECNEVLTDIKKEEVISSLMPKTKKYYDTFKKCPGCDRIYWEGSHYEKMKKFIQKLMNSEDTDYI